jgi:WD40 repeat protein
MELYAGCYERFLFRFAVNFDSKHCADLALVASKPAHRNAIKCIASHGSYVATGGADDQIHLFDTARDKDLGFVVNPVEGAVPCLSFVVPNNSRQPTHFLSGAITWGQPAPRIISRWAYALSR